VYLYRPRLAISFENLFLLTSYSMNQNPHFDSSLAHDKGFTHDDNADIEKKELQGPPANDPFGNEEGGDVQYRTMKWW
jgi:hypothetical protein